MLIWFVVLYLMVSVGIGLFAATRVHNARDFAVAGRTLPLPVVIATVFATWFGSEAVFGVSAQFVTDGLGGVVADPFGASLCLVIAGLFFATKLYKLNILTVGDYYRMRYNRPVELITTVCIIISYLGWVSAQIKAMGLVLTIVTHGALSEEMGMVLGALIVVTYTTFGGMFSVAILDFVQMAVSIGGLLYIGYVVSGLTGGVAPVIEHAAAAGKLDFFPPADARLWLAFIGTGLTMMLGSVPQQDVFQRITSAKTARIAVIGSIVGALIYFGVTFIPMFIAYSATLIDPAGMGRLMEDDSQRVLPMLILQHTPMLAQVLFFGAVLSAIMSTASATLLAPSITFAENIVKSFVPALDDRRLLYVMRVAIVVFAFAVLMVALNTESTIFAMVENAYKVTLVGAFVPLFFGAYWRRASTQGALAAIFGGISSWLLIEFIVGDASVVPAQLYGLLASVVGMVVGSLLPQWIGRRASHEPLHAELHHHAAAATHHVTGAPHRH
jgi:solute:Na+ symporter, SSS family